VLVRPRCHQQRARNDELTQPLTISELLASLAIEPRRVAVEHNLEIIRRENFADTTIREGDRIEIANFIGVG
jgi:thiamine biosynthesis protein ThiS